MTDATQSPLADALAVAGSRSGSEDPALADPFASPETLPARPWPQAALAQPSGNGYTVRFGEAATTSYYPFEPRLPVSAGSRPVPEQGATAVPSEPGSMPEPRH